MKNILLLTDFSENSINALRYAIRFFKNSPCHFYILNVQKASTYITGNLMAALPADTVYETLIAEPKKELGKIVETLTAHDNTSSYEFTPLCTFDDFTSAVNNSINTYSIELIVMGTNGATGAKEILFGSNTLQIIRNINCPVLVIPENYTYRPISIAMCCIQNEGEVTLEAFKPFVDLLKIHSPFLHIVELDNREEEAGKVTQKHKALLTKVCGSFSCQFHQLSQLPEWVVIHTATQLLKIDLNAIFIEKETFLERLLSGSEMSSITYGAKVPLLFLP